MKAGILFVVVLALAFGGVRAEHYFKDCAGASAAARALSAPPPVDVIEATRVGAVEPLIIPGQTAAWHTSTIYSRVNGYVGNWFVDIGGHVAKGQGLATIETPELDAQLAAARAQLKATQAQVKVRKAEANLARTTYERWRDSPDGVVSEQEREQKRADYDSAMGRLQAAEAEVALEQARVDQYVALTQYKQVTAPFDGVITWRHIDIGDLVTAGSTTSTTPLYVMTQNDPMRVFVQVPQSAAVDLMQGRVPVEIQASDGERRTYTGNVTKTSEAINEQTRTLRVEVDITNPQQHLVPGMYVKVGFSLQPKGVVQVPAAAVLFRSTGPQVARVDRVGRISFQSVTIARDDGATVELGSGVSPGDKLALNVNSQIGNGEIVRIHSVPSSATPAQLTATKH